MVVADDIQHALRVVRGVQAAVCSSRPKPASSAPPPASVPAATDAIGSTTSTAFISWAHSHRSWTPEQSSAWESQVAAFAGVLRLLGIAADVDLFHLDEPVDWTRYGARQIEEANHTLIVISQAWAERWSGSNSPREGAGAAAEADTLKGLFSRDQEAWQRRLVLVMFPEVESAVVPPDLQRVARVSVDPADPDSFEPLIRILTGQPRYPKPPLGVPPVLGSVYAESAGLAALRERLAEIEKRREVLSKRATSAAIGELERLKLSEAATRGFIDAELTVEE